MKQSPQILLLPGWQGSGDDHWQSHWERRYGYQRVQQHDWQRPLRGDWTARLEECVLDASASAPIVLVAHSLGCILTAWWAAHSRHTVRVQAALLVAPGDVEQPELAAQLPGWAPMARKPLPFTSWLVASRDDPYCSFARAQALAADWGARLIDHGACGHINAESGLGAWPAGKALLDSLLAV
ncbi:MAG: RBBP9/YdeN family alpha/beta hydrolase [Burkholderiaceae bacterium]